MGAKNWRVCPKCAANGDGSRAEANAEADAAYGKVPWAEYEALRSKAQFIGDMEETLREDYSFDIDKGVFFVSYCCSCERCGFKFKYQKQEPIP